VPSEEEDEEAIIARRRKAREEMLNRLKLQQQDEDSQSSTRANSPSRPREQTPDSDAVADEAVSHAFYLTPQSCRNLS